MGKYFSGVRDPGAAMKVITSVEPVVVRGKLVDVLKLECGHEVISRMVGHHEVGKRTRCTQCRR